MPGRASNQRGVRLAQIALSAYFEDRPIIYQENANASQRFWSEEDVIDLVSDLLLLASSNEYDLFSILSKVEAHIKAETGHEC